MPKKVAIVLFNMGGPDSLDNVRPFLRNLFADRAIIDLPNPFRYLLAEFISRKRAKAAKKNYALMGGKSPLVKESLQQATAVQEYLEKSIKSNEVKCFVAMRYWGPSIKSAQSAIKEWGATTVVLLPLYPQYSTTTTGTFFKAWDKAEKAGQHTKIISSYEINERFITAHVKTITKHYKKCGSPKNTRVIMSAHGLPERIINAGDPYQRQIEESCAAIAKQLPKDLQDMSLAYQSRVGRLKWIGPSTLDEIERASVDKKAVLIVPIAFVSEHIETLVELDIDYKKKALDMGIKTYLRVPALGINSDYIASLGNMAIEAIKETSA